MARHIHERQLVPVDLRVGEPEFDADAPRLFFLQPIRVNARERTHQRALAVVDVPGRADDEAGHRDFLRCARSRLPGRAARRRRSSGVALRCSFFLTAVLRG